MISFTVGLMTGVVIGFILGGYVACCLFGEL